MSQSKILKVSELNFLAKKILEANFPQILVEGEISNLAEPASGHIYFSLKDENAQVRAAMFRLNKATLKFKPKNGDHVIVTAQVGLYEVRGDYQLIVDKIEPAGEGVLHAKFLELKKRLDAEGLFDSQYKKSLPQIPKTIGVITSPTGAVIRDILNVLRRRFPSAKIIIYPTQVQGKEAHPKIAATLAKANEREECEVLIIARGGGSLEDLWPFNEEVVARAIFASKLPVISAVGHETDFTISDFVADLRAPTPSAAAELVVPDVSEWQRRLTSLNRQLINLVVYKIDQFKFLLKSLTSRLRHPKYYLAEKMQRLDEIERRLHMVIRYRLNHFKNRFVKIGVMLDAVSPLATLSRGYAVITKDQKVIASVTKVKVGDKLEAKLSDGKIDCLVQGSTKQSLPTLES